jgi:hypothetical protein
MICLVYQLIFERGEHPEIPWCCFFAVYFFLRVVTPWVGPWIAEPWVSEVFMDKEFGNSYHDILRVCMLLVITHAVHDAQVRSIALQR